MRQIMELEWDRKKFVIMLVGFAVDAKQNTVSDSFMKSLLMNGRSFFSVILDIRSFES
jgi:hypothetical protein